LAVQDHLPNVLLGTSCVRVRHVTKMSFALVFHVEC
jgi:hypothetical protein